MNFISRKQLRIAFVAPWYGDNIGGGAEAECRGLVREIKKRRSDIKVHVYTTTLREFSADWNGVFFESGVHIEKGVRVYRFNPTLVDRSKFHPLNGYRLMPQTLGDLAVGSKTRSPLTETEEKEIFGPAMIHSPAMYRRLRLMRAYYDYFVFIPYMFGTSFRGSRLVGKKAIMIPCLHDERYAYMNLYREMMHNAVAQMYHVPAEQRLANRIFGPTNSKQFLLGEMVDDQPRMGDERRFRERFGIQQPFILYAGRKIKGKGLPKLIDLFQELKKKEEFADLKLVLIGKGDLDYRRKEGVIDLGFVNEDEKADAYKAAHMLCQPSPNESFSIVMMESWLQGTPCLVPDYCDVTREHIETSGGGFVYSDQNGFENAVRKILGKEPIKRELGGKGEAYVRSQFTPEIITNRFCDLLWDLKKN